jgi:hypothetical protein
MLVAQPQKHGRRLAAQGRCGAHAPNPKTLQQALMPAKRLQSALLPAKL